MSRREEPERTSAAILQEKRQRRGGGGAGCLVRNYKLSSRARELRKLKAFNWKSLSSERVERQSAEPEMRI